MQAPVKLLIVDDSNSILLGLEAIFRNDACNQYDITFASNGNEAYSLVLANRPDIILMDIEMPVLNGIEALKLIRNVNKLKSIPVIMMSSSRTFDEAFEAGANDFLMKPLNQYEVLQRLRLNISLSRKAVELRSSHEKLKTQKQAVDIQNEVIEKQKKELLDDLKYASYLQKAILPEKSYLSEIIPEHFIYYEPKNIVSGDFYWFMQKNDLLFFAVGDCTGHGLSGALMSMMGTSILYEIINGHNIVEPSLILNNLRSRVINLLHQKGDIGEASNGMDLSLCVFNKSSRILKYAGANNPMYIVRNNGTLEVFKADRMPIGIHINHVRPFSNIETYIEKEDNLYLFTDGYADQFGGPDEQKFRYNRFQDLLKSIYDENINDQLTLIRHAMIDWKGSLEQVDDMLIIGLRL